MDEFGYEEEKDSSWSVLIGGLFLGVILSRLFFPAKYEGETAEYWFNEYDYQTAVNYDLEEELTMKEDCLEEIEDEAVYWSFNDYSELQDKLDEIDDLVSGCL